MQILLNSIALEPDRWTEDKVLTFSLEELLKPIAAAGFGAVEAWQFHVAALTREEVRRLKARADSLGLRLPIGGMYPIFHLEGSERDRELAKFDLMFDIADALGFQVLKLMPGRMASAKMTPPQWRTSVEFVREVLRRSESRDTVLTCETHVGTLADDPDVLLRFLDAVGSDRLKVCWQPFDFKSTEKAIDLYDRLSPHVAHLHLQGRRDGKLALLEDSDIDYCKVLSHVLASGFDGFIAIEFVRNCVVDSPEQFDLTSVLGNAQRDRCFVESVLGSE